MRLFRAYGLARKSNQIGRLGKTMDVEYRALKMKTEDLDSKEAQKLIDELLLLSNEWATGRTVCN